MIDFIRRWARALLFTVFNTICFGYLYTEYLSGVDSIYLLLGGWIMSVSVGIVFCAPSQSVRTKMILDRLDELENLTTYTDREESQRWGAINALEDLVENCD